MIHPQQKNYMKILKTERLILRTLTLDDAEFYLKLTNEASWIQYIGDKGIRTLDAAKEAITDGYIAKQQSNGFSLYLVERSSDQLAMGLCGLVKREGLDGIDIGYAFSPAFWRLGYAFEAATGVMAYAKDTLGLQQLLAIISPDNAPSAHLLEKLGFTLKALMPWKDNNPVKLYQRDL